ncbi:MAG: flagellar biosynthesis protein FlhB [Paracoccaceae bacterium]|nr:MAG: flagellar biosynthesis protein FlhB [Paracoccaceae bacterium]
MTEESAAEKEFDPSEQRLREAREKGQFARSPDLTTAAAYAGFALAATAFGANAAQRLGDLGMVLLAQADRLAPSLSQAASAPLGGLIGSAMLAVAPIFLIPGAAAGLALVAQRAVVVTPGNLAPRLDRISPLAGLRNKFGRRGLFEFAKSTAKLTLTCVILGTFLMAEAGRIAATVSFAPGIAAAELMRQLAVFLWPVCMLAAALGLIDYLWQRADHLRSHRMSRREMADEMKSAEGDPHMKARRRQRGYDIATNRMIADVATADVVVVNPTHYAVALKWDRAARRAPVCVAKGVDEVAARIRSRAAEHGVPLHRDPATARALHATVDIGAEIRPEHYQAVAAAIRFAEAMRRRNLWRRTAP